MFDPCPPPTLDAEAIDGPKALPVIPYYAPPASLRVMKLQQEINLLQERIYRSLAIPLEYLKGG